jgi:hypothetical protein
MDAPGVDYAKASNPARPSIAGPILHLSLWKYLLEGGGCAKHGRR